MAHNPAIPLDVPTDIAPTTTIGATLSPRITAATPDEVERLSARQVPAVRMALAERPDLPAGVVSLVAAIQDAKVLKSLPPTACSPTSSCR